MIRTSFLVRKLLVEVSGFLIIVNVYTGVPLVVSSLYLTCSESVPVCKSATPWPRVKQRFSFVTGRLSPVELLLRKYGFALIVNLFMLKSRPKGLSCVIKLIARLDCRFQFK